MYVPSPSDAVVVAAGLSHAARAHCVSAGEGGGGGRPGPGLCVGKPCGRTASDPVQPLAGETGKETGTVQQPGGAVC